MLWRKKARRLALRSSGTGSWDGRLNEGLSKGKARLVGLRKCAKNISSFQETCGGLSTLLKLPRILNNTKSQSNNQFCTCVRSCTQNLLERALTRRVSLQKSGRFLSTFLTPTSTFNSWHSKDSTPILLQVIFSLAQMSTATDQQ